MTLDLARFYQACNPSKTLIAGNPDDQKYYIDFSSVRGSNIIQELGRTITRYQMSIKLGSSQLLVKIVGIDSMAG